MKFRVEFTKFSDKTTYFKDVTADNAVSARNLISQAFPESRVTMSYPLQFEPAKLNRRA